MLFGLSSGFPRAWGGFFTLGVGQQRLREPACDRIRLQGISFIHRRGSVHAGGNPRSPCSRPPPPHSATIDEASRGGAGGAAQADPGLVHQSRPPSSLAS